MGVLQSWPVIGNTWILGVAIDHYKHHGDLLNPVRDVDALVGLLKKKYDLGSSIDHIETSKRIRILRNKQAANADDIKEGLVWLKQNVKKDDKVIICFAGHGYYDQDDEVGWWIPADAEGEGQYLFNDTIKTLLATIKCKHVLLIADSCFSGSLLLDRTGGLNEVDNDEGYYNQLESKSSRYALCSGMYDQKVQDSSGDHSPFMQSLLDLLNENVQTRRNIAQIGDEVAKRTKLEIGENNFTGQRPICGAMDIKGHLHGEFVFRLKNSLVSNVSVTPQHISRQTQKPAQPKARKSYQDVWKAILLDHHLVGFNQTWSWSYVIHLTQSQHALELSGQAKKPLVNGVMINGTPTNAETHTRFGRVIYKFRLNDGPKQYECQFEFSSIATGITRFRLEIDGIFLVNVQGLKPPKRVHKPKAANSDKAIRELAKQLFDELRESRPDAATLSYFRKQIGELKTSNTLSFEKTAGRWYFEDFHEAIQGEDNYNRRTQVKRYLDRLNFWIRDIENGIFDREFLFHQLQEELKIDLDLLKIAISGHHIAHPEQKPYQKVKELLESFEQSLQ